jgi:hypothetical protein
MVQTTPPPLAPPVGIAGAPVAVALTGNPVQIPFPTGTVGGSQPVPYLFQWVVLKNASPYVITVSTGMTTVQIAAFNADAVQIYPGGGPHLSFTALAGSGTPAPGTDSTVYPTFYNDIPPGTYPMFIGQGAPLQLQSVLAQFSPTGLAALTSIVYGLFSTVGFGGMSLYLQESSGHDVPLQVIITWFSALTGNFFVRSVNMVMAAGGRIQLSQPHVSPAFQIQIQNVNAGQSATYSMVLINTVLPTALWSVGASSSGPESSWLIQPTSTAVVAGASTVIGSPTLDLFAGPAQLAINPAGNVNWKLVVQQATATGAGTVWTTLSGGTFGNGSVPRTGGVLPLQLPPVPVRLLWTNNDGISRTPICSLVADDFRIAA